MNTHRLNIDFPADEFIYLKMICAKKKISIKDFIVPLVIEAVKDFINNEKELELTRDIIKLTKEKDNIDHFIIPRKLMAIIRRTNVITADLALEFLDRAYTSVEKNIEDGWKFLVKTPLKRGRETYSKSQIIKVLETLKNHQVIKSYSIEGENLIGYIDAVNIFSEVFIEEE